MTGINESLVEDAALAWLETLGYAVLHGPDIAIGMPNAERSDPNYRDVVLERRLRDALLRLNPDLPSDAIEDAFRKLTRSDAPSLDRTQPRHSSNVGGWRGSRVSASRWLYRRHAGSGDRLRRTR